MDKTAYQKPIFYIQGDSEHVNPSKSRDWLFFTTPNSVKCQCGDWAGNKCREN
jgi:hypothetical protein